MESRMNNAQQDDADQDDAGPRTQTATPKIRRWKKFAVLALTLLVSVWLGWNWRLATQGYCFEEDRFLSDREFLERGMARSYYLLSYTDPDKELDPTSKAYNANHSEPRIVATSSLVAYPEWRAYLLSHPECCHIKRQSFRIPFSGRTGGWGLYDVYVDINPLPPELVKELLEDPRQSPLARSELLLKVKSKIGAGFEMTSCGKSATEYIGG